MIKRAQEVKSEVKRGVCDGVGEVQFTHLLTEQELPEKSRLYSVVTLKPGNSIGYHQHVGDGESYWILEGTAQVVEDGQTYELHPGDVVMTYSGHSHSIQNIGEDDLKFVASIILD